MLYDKAQMTELVETLRRYHRELVSIAGDGVSKNDTSSDLGQACEKLKQAWSNPNSGVENTALIDFNAAKDQWDTAYHEKALTTLDAVATAVESALHNAIAADISVGGAFGHH